MNRQLFRLVSIFIIAVVATAGGAAESLSFRDDFSGYAENSAGEPKWETSHVGFSIRQKTMLADVPNDHGYAVLRGISAGRALIIEADVSPRESRGPYWRTAGTGIYLDARNYWHVALVESPEGRRFVELSEMLDGNWNAQNEPGSRLTLAKESKPFAWTYGKTYRVRVTLTRTGDKGKISGEVLEGDATCFHSERLLDARAVDQGWPMLDAGAIAVGFSKVNVTINEPVEITAAGKKLPSFDVSTRQNTPPHKATGFFRVEADGETWWIVDPKGQLTLSIGTDHVNHRGHGCEALGYAPYGRNAIKRYGNADAWAHEATRRLRAWNFNVLGAGSAPEARYQGLAHTEFLSFGADFSSLAGLVTKTTWTGWPDVFDPRFERFCELRARQRCEPCRDDPWLLGYFLDNELEWWGKSHHKWGLAEDACKLPAQAAGKIALVASLRKYFKDDVAEFNAAFGAKLGNFDALSSLTELPQPKTDRAKEALDGFIGEAAKRYFEITSAAVRRHDPNHLVLGCRFAHDAPDSAWVSAGSTCDIVTVNYYPRVDLWNERVTGIDDLIRSRFALCKKPLIVTEWGFPALDAVDTDGRPLPSKHGAGMRVDTQEQKARCYAIFQRYVFSFPFVVGSHFFMWADEPSRGISSTFPEDSNYGLVSETDEPYPLVTQTATRVNALMPSLHAGAIKSADVASGGAQPNPSTRQPVARSAVTFERTATGYTIDNGVLRLIKAKDDGNIFDRAEWRADANSAWIELGSYVPVLRVVAGSQSAWPHAEHVTDVHAREQTPGRLVLDVECVATTAPSWKTGYRLTVEAGRPWIRAKCLWVENTGTTAWQLHDYFHYLPSRIGGKTEDDEIGNAAVPNYWLKFSAWRDPALKLNYGIMPPQDDERVHCQFYIDPQGMRHPDCNRTVERDLKPGERWSAEADEPEVLIFGLRESAETPCPWLELVPEVPHRAPTQR